MSPAEIILREAEKLPWYEWQCIVKAMEFVHRKRADKLTLDDSEKTHEELMFHVEPHRKIRNTFCRMGDSSMAR